MASTVIGSVMVDLGMNTARFDSDTKRARKTAMSFERRMKKSFNDSRKWVNNLFPSLTKLATLLAAVAGPAAIGYLTVSSLNAVDALAKTSDKLGITTEKLASLQMAGQLTGVSVETTNMALQRMVRRVAEAAKGTGEAQGALRELGIDAVKLSKMPIDEQFKTIADEMSKTATQGDRVRLAMKLFDSEGVALVNTLALQRKGLNEVEREAKALGLTVSRFDAAKIEQANDTVLKAKRAFKGLGNTIAIAVSPIITALGEKFINAAIDSNGFRDQVGSGMRFVAKAVGFVADTVRGLQVVWALVTTGVAELIGMQLNNIKLLANGVASVINAINPGDDIEFTFINDLASSFHATIGTMEEKLALLVSSPLPSEGVNEFFDTAIERANEFAEIATANKIRESALGILTDDELEAARAQREQMLTFEQRYQKELTSIANNAAYERFKFSKMTSAQQTKFVIGQAVAMTQGVAQTSRTMFKINKAAGIANAVINTYQGVTNALAQFPPPVSFVMAGLQLAAGLAQVSAIKNTSFGTGNAAPSLAGLGGGSSTINTVPAVQPTLPGQETEQKSTNININVTGSIIGEDLRAIFADHLKDVLDLGQVNLTANGQAVRVA